MLPVTAATARVKTAIMKIRKNWACLVQRSKCDLPALYPQLPTPRTDKPVSVGVSVLDFFGCRFTDICYLDVERQDLTCQRMISINRDFIV